MSPAVQQGYFHIDKGITNNEMHRQLTKLRHAITEALTRGPNPPAFRNWCLVTDAWIRLSHLHVLYSEYETLAADFRDTDSELEDRIITTARNVSRLILLEAHAQTLAGFRVLNDVGELEDVGKLS